MSTIDKRETHNQQLKAFITGFLGDPAHDNQSSRSLTAGVFRIALASLEAEPVAYIGERMLEDLIDGARSCGRIWPEVTDKMSGEDRIPLFTAPPDPVSVPDEATPENIDILASTFAPRGVTYQWDRDECNAAADSWNACRAAMLQGKSEPVNQHPELTVWYGSMPESNGKTNWTAILHRKGEGIQDGMTIDRSEYPDRVLYVADRVRYLIGEKADRPCILDYDADAHSEYVKPSNSPAVLDGWVDCSERNPEEVGRYWCYVEEQNDLGKSQYQWNCSWNGERWWVESENGGRVTHWMPLPAAPQQEVKP